MPIKTGDYQQLRFNERIVDSGRLRNLPGYAIRMLWLMIRHANFPSGWSWPGTKRKELKLGLSYSDQLKGLYYLVRFGYFKAWGYAKTKGQKTLAFKFDLEVPQTEVPGSKIIRRELYDLIGRKDRVLTLRPLLDHLTTCLGQPYDPFSLEKDITINNPKEPKDDFYKSIKNENQEQIPGPAAAKEIFQRITGFEDVDQELTDRLGALPDNQVKLKHYIAGIGQLFAARGKPGSPKAGKKEEFLKLGKLIIGSHNAGKKKGF